MLLWPGIKNWKPICLSPTSWDERGSFFLWGCPSSIGWEIFEVFVIKDWRRALLCFAQGCSHISLLIPITGLWNEGLILQMKIMRLREVQNFCKVTELTNSGIGTQIQVSSIQKPIALKDTTHNLCTQKNLGGRESQEIYHFYWSLVWTLLEFNLSSEAVPKWMGAKWWWWAPLQVSKTSVHFRRTFYHPACFWDASSLHQHSKHK